VDPIPSQTPSATPPPKRCPRCQSELSAGAASGGMCAKCLLGIGLGQGGELVITGGGAQEPPPTPAELAPLFPQYEMVELIGRGGMGAVYKARQRGLDRMAAIKVLPTEASSDPTFAERFSREARALAKLNHANIVNIYDSGQAGGLYYFVMEYVDGANLRQMIRARSASPKEALGLVAQVCEALQYAHEEGVVHRDIKPENILIDRRGRVKIADFGLAKLLGVQVGDVTLTNTHQAMGTPHYMAPEQWETPLGVDHRADLYALGVVFYELLTGELPLGRFALPSQKADVDIKIDEVVLKTLAKEPALRYQTANEIRSDVQALAARPVRQPKVSRGCIGAPLYRLRVVFDPFLPIKRKLYGMPLTSNWIPLGLVGFLWFACAVTDFANGWLWMFAIGGTIAVLRNTKPV
jgi:serine/threonine protein kinase